MTSLTKDTNELASFRYRALTGTLTDDEKKNYSEKLNKTQIKWLKEKSTKLSEENAQKIIDEFIEEEEENKKFWDNIREE